MTLRRLILLCSLIGLTRSPVLADTEEIYRFERTWPVLPQPWYFDEIWDIAISQQGYVYVADRRSNRVQKWTSNGQLVSQLGTFSNGLPPIELAVDSQENVYVSYTTNSVMTIDHSKEILPETTASRLTHWADLIRKFNAHGELIFEQWGQYGQCAGSVGHLAVDHQDQVYITCVLGTAGQVFVHKLSSDGQLLEKWPVGSNGKLAIDREHLYLLDRTDNQVYKYTLRGEPVADWPTDQKSQTRDFIYRTQDIAVDNRGQVYVTDNFNRIQQFTSEGELLKEWRDEINTNGGIQIVLDRNSTSWQSLKSILARSYCSTTVPDEANAPVETCHQWQQFEALVDYESTFPTTVAVGPQGKIYVGYSMPLSAIKKYSSTGQFLTQWTNGGSSTPQLLESFKGLLQGFMQSAGESGAHASFQFHQPADIAMGKNGDLYVVDILAHRVLKFSTKEGKIEEPVAQWGGLGNVEGRFSNPKGIAIDTDDNIYIVDTNNYRIQKFTADGTFITQWGKLGIGDRDFLSPTHIAVDKSNHVYVVDYSARQVKKFSSEGRFIKAFGDEHLGEPWSIAVDNNNIIYVTDFEKSRLKKFTTDGEFLGEWHTQSRQAGQFEGFVFAPSYVTTDAVGNIYVSNYAHDSIQKFAPNGQLITQWGSFGTNPGQFKDSNALAVSPEGDRVYVVEQMNNRIQVFNRTLHDVGKAIIIAAIPALTQLFLSTIHRNGD